MRRTALALATAAVLAAPSGAATLWWDPNGTAAGTGGSGNWDLGSPSWAQLASGISGYGDLWPAAASGGLYTTAALGGSAGTVTLKAALTAAGLDFVSSGYVLDGNGYRLSLGNAQAIGVLRVASGATATLRAQLASFQAGQPVDLRGGGTLVVDARQALPQELRVFEASTLRLERTDAAASSLVWLRGPGAQLDFGRVHEVELGALGGTGQTVVLGDRVLRYSGGAGISELTANLALQGTTASSLVFGTEQALTYRWEGSATRSTLGTLDVVRGDLTLAGVQLDLLSTSAASPLRVQAGGVLRMLGSQVQQSGRTLLQDGAVLELGVGSVLQGQTLALEGANSRLSLTLGGSASFTGIDPLAQGGSVEFGGGTLEIGAGGPNSSFAGLLTGSSGLLRKLGGGVLTLSNDDNSFAGRVQVESGLLVASAGALRLSTLTLIGSGRSSFTPQAGQFSIGALSGSFDLSAVPGSMLALGAPGNSDRWQGRFVGGQVSIQKINAGEQTLLGSLDGQDFETPLLLVSGGRLVLSGARFNTTSSAPYSTVVAGAGSELRLEAGAQLQAQGLAIVDESGLWTLAGSGTKFLPAPGSHGEVSLAGGGRLRLEAGAQFSAYVLKVGSGSSVWVGPGSHLQVASRWETQDADATLTVDRGTAEIYQPWHWSPAHQGTWLLSDPGDGRAALTVSTSYDPGSFFNFTGRIADGPSGPGSLRKVGDGLSWWLSRPLEITGRLIVEGGNVVLNSAADLAAVELVVNRASPLDLSRIPHTLPVQMAALSGNQAFSVSHAAGLAIGGSGGRDASFAGRLDVAALNKLGPATQTLAGGGSLGDLSLSGGRLVLSGASFQARSAQFASGSELLVTSQLTLPGDLAAGQQWRLTDPNASTSALRLLNQGVSVHMAATLADGPAGPGGLLLDGQDAHYALGGNLLFTGPLVVRGSGTEARLLAPLATPRLVARAGGRILVGDQAQTWAVGKTLQSDGGAFSYDHGSRMVGGTLRGADHVVGSGGFSFDGSTLAANARLQVNGATSFSNGTLRGRIDATAPLRLDGTSLGSGAQVHASGLLQLDDADNAGLIELAGGALASLQSPFTTGQGGRLLIASGARVEGETLTLAAGLLVNDGVLDAPLVLDYLGRAQGSGRFGSVTVNAGGIFSPGHSPAWVHSGDSHFSSGGVFEVEVADAAGAPGSGYDQWQIDGNASFEAGLTPNTRFTLQLVALDGARFDARRAYRWTVLDAASVSGWRDGELALDTTRFGAAPAERFSLQWTAGAGGRQLLDIVYAPVPEPTSALLWLAGLAGVAARRFWRS